MCSYAHVYIFTSSNHLNLSGEGLAVHYVKILEIPHDRFWTGTHRVKEIVDATGKLGK